jgi:hypothetical protein
MDWPADIDRRVIPTDAALRLGEEVGGCLVEKVSTLAQREETMCKSRWDPELLMVAAREPLPDPSPK